MWNLKAPPYLKKWLKIQAVLYYVSHVSGSCVHPLLRKWTHHSISRSSLTCILNNCMSLTDNECWSHRVCCLTEIDSFLWGGCYKRANILYKYIASKTIALTGSLPRFAWLEGDIIWAVGWHPCFIWSQKKKAAPNRIEISGMNILKSREKNTKKKPTGW